MKTTIQTQAILVDLKTPSLCPVCAEWVDQIWSLSYVGTARVDPVACPSCEKKEG